MSAPRSPSQRTLPAWLRACAWLLVTFMLVRGPATVAAGPLEAAMGVVAETGSAEAGVAVDDDGGDEVLRRAPAPGCRRDDGAIEIDRVRRAHAVGSDPPWVPPPEV